MKKLFLLLLFVGCAQNGVTTQTCTTLDNDVAQLTTISTDTYVYGFADGEDNAHENDMGVIEGFAIHCSTSDPLLPYVQGSGITLTPTQVSVADCLAMTQALAIYTDGVFNSTITYHP